jgi:hypothetical protein
MTDSGMGFGLSAPANERADTRLHSRAKRSAVLGGAVLATGGFVTALAGSALGSRRGRRQTASSTSGTS